ncbi:ribosome maturation factor RimM [Candidatus Cytomitobacter primus]|uniref:Ribosome maturation factor RimM n=1 Tax=Candidatus Cytomitobacter primus TaxID=2066024 RepID=A0A5C0UGS9_9PROT|nr:ribosome maturation factor RimM [Candidatus Cytomitobacter primus]QEK38753.1 16S rRNA processing protein RimM [Candidatus Cytomitobacter primus]
MDNNYIIIGKTFKPHGLKGNLQMHLYSEDVDYSEVYINDQQLIIEDLNILQDNKSIIKFKNLDKIEDIEHLCKNNVYIKKAKLPNNELYWDELISMQIYTPNGDLVATVSAVHDFGAGLVLETELDCMFSWEQVEKFDKTTKTITLKDNKLY